MPTTIPFKITRMVGNGNIVNTRAQAEHSSSSRSPSFFQLLSSQVNPVEAKFSTARFTSSPVFSAEENNTDLDVA